MRTENENELPKVNRASYNKYMKLLMATTIHNRDQVKGGFIPEAMRKS